MIYGTTPRDIKHLELHPCNEYWDINNTYIWSQEYLPVGFTFQCNIILILKNENNNPVF